MSPTLLSSPPHNLKQRGVVVGNTPQQTGASYEYPTLLSPQGLGVGGSMSPNKTLGTWKIHMLLR